MPQVGWSGPQACAAVQQADLELHCASRLAGRSAIACARHCRGVLAAPGPRRAAARMAAQGVHACCWLLPSDCPGR